MMINKVGGKSAEAFRTISEVSDDIDVPQHVLRFWETKFNHTVGIFGDSISTITGQKAK